MKKQGAVNLPRMASLWPYAGGIYHLNRKAPLRAAWRVPRYDFRTAPDWKRQNGMNKLSICPVWRLCGRMWGNLPPEPKNAFTGFLARCARQFRRPL